MNTNTSADACTPDTIAQVYSFGNSVEQMAGYLTFMTFWRIRNELSSSGLATTSYQGQLGSTELNYQKKLLAHLRWMTEGTEALAKLQITRIPYPAQTIFNHDLLFFGDDYGVSTANRSRCCTLGVQYSGGTISLYSREFLIEEHSQPASSVSPDEEQGL